MSRWNPWPYFNYMLKVSAIHACCLWELALHVGVVSDNIPSLFRNLITAVQVDRLCRRIDCYDCYAIIVIPVPLPLSIVPIFPDRNPRSVNSFLRNVYCAVVTTKPFLTTEGLQSSSCRRGLTKKGWNHCQSVPWEKGKVQCLRKNILTITYSRSFPGTRVFRWWFSKNIINRHTARWVSGNTHIRQWGARFESRAQNIDSSEGVLSCVSSVLPGIWRDSI